MWNDGYDTYNKYRLYEKPYFYGTERDPTVKNNELHDFIIPLYSITSQGSFYRARSSNAKYEGTLNVDGYYHLSFTPTCYFYDTKVEIQEGFVTQGMNAIQITLNQPVLVQTYYANKNLGNKLSEWELQASDVNTKVYDPAKDGTSVLYFYDDNSDITQQVPDNYYYIVAIYFANGKSIYTSVMQK